MTANQIARLNYLENARSNVAREKETNRANIAKEIETNRSNVANERETHRSNIAKETETNRHNVRTEDETERYQKNKNASDYINAGANVVKSIGQTIFGKGGALGAFNPISRR